MPASDNLEYLDYASFDQKVETTVKPQHYCTFKHILPTIDICSRLRFLLTLSLTEHISTSKTLLETGKHLPDANYRRYLKYMMAAK